MSAQPVGPAQPRDSAHVHLSAHLSVSIRLSLTTLITCISLCRPTSCACALASCAPAATRPTHSASSLSGGRRCAAGVCMVAGPPGEPGVCMRWVVKSRRSPGW